MSRSAVRKAAVIGCGRMGAFTSQAVRNHAPSCWFPLAHAEAITAHPELELMALCDANPSGLARARAHYGTERGYADHRAMLAEFIPELVGIATRTPGRAAIISDCIAAGTRALHVEKPLCNSMAEWRTLNELFATPGIHVTYGTVRRFFPIYRNAITMANSGDYGLLREIRVVMGEGALYWTHPHAVDLILAVAGDRKVASVQATLDNVTIGSHSAQIVSDPVIAAASIWFDDGLVGHIGRAPGTDLILSCRSGEITVLNDGHELELRNATCGDPYPRRQSLSVVLDTAPSGALAPIGELVGCLAGNEAAIVANRRNRNDILRGQQIIFAMVQSHLTGGQMITLDDIDPAMEVLAKTGGTAA